MIVVDPPKIKLFASMSWSPFLDHFFSAFAFGIDAPSQTLFQSLCERRPVSLLGLRVDLIRTIWTPTSIMSGRCWLWGKSVRTDLTIAKVCPYYWTIQIISRSCIPSPRLPIWTYHATLRQIKRLGVVTPCILRELHHCHGVIEFRNKDLLLFLCVCVLVGLLHPHVGRSNGRLLSRTGVITII